ncbi:uncharacterized protein [Drosophila takahashii]|uniref:uncharacterized protein n=1 Tax=Drosophila takahashii TaxID=29030 RepID=UPI001CF87646|nr:uncharacterized protein LOC108066680 [Drosophila takahashii]
MPSSQFHLLLLLLLGTLILVAGQKPTFRVPPQDLQVPNFGGESFERFASGAGSGSASVSSSGSSASQETSDEMREQLKQLLSDQLANAFAPLATTPFTQRQPAIASPASGAAARSQFAADPDQDQNEEESPEAEAEAEEEEGDEEEEQETTTLQPQPSPPPLPQPGGAEEELAGGQVEVDDYNAWRDNFYDLNEDGSYIFGYSIPHGVRRWEKGFYSEGQHGQVVEGFYVQPRHDSQGLRYELRCYRADSNGYQPLPVEFLRTPPIVRRDEVPQVNCFR